MNNDNDQQPKGVLHIARRPRRSAEFEETICGQYVAKEHEKFTGKIVRCPDCVQRVEDIWNGRSVVSHD